jgi:hypothetical protein
MHKFAVRALVLVIFFALMFVWREFVHFVVEDLGIIPDLALIGGIFVVAWMIDRRDCKKREEPPYSAREYAAEFHAQRWVYAFWTAIGAITFIGYYGFR